MEVRIEGRSGRSRRQLRDPVEARPDEVWVSQPHGGVVVSSGGVLRYTCGGCGGSPPPTFGASPPRGGIRMKLSIDNHCQRS